MSADPSSILRVAEVLAMDCLDTGSPVVLAGAPGLDRPVRWVHVSDVADVGAVLNGGELVLTTGQAMAPSTRAAVYVVRQLAAAGAAGLVVELGPGYREVQPAAVAAAERAELPLVALRAPVRFIEVTERVHRSLVAAQLSRVERAHTAHEAFTALSLESATPSRIVEVASEMAGSSVVLEDLGRRVLAYRAVGSSAAVLLEGWERRSRVADTAQAGWQSVDVGLPGRRWGRLVVTATPDRDHTSMVLERAAQALELHRMTQRDELTQRLRIQGSFLLALLEGAISEEQEAVARWASLGLRPGRAWCGLVVRRTQAALPNDAQAQRRAIELSELAAEGLREARLPGVVGVLDAEHVGVIVTLSSRDREGVALGALAAHLATRAEDVRIGASLLEPGLLAAAAGLHGAMMVVDLAVTLPASSRGYHRHEDLRLRGLLHALRSDARVQSFAEAELAPALAHEAEHQDGTLLLLRQFLAAGGSRTELARLAHRSRTALYPRLRRLEAVLGVPLDEHESRLALAVALMAYDAAHPPTPAARPARRV